MKAAALISNGNATAGPQLNTFLTRPHFEFSESAVLEFEDLWSQLENRSVEFTSKFQKWWFLVWVAEQKGCLFHGSGNPNIEEFTPRKSNDIEEFGNACAVYASSDPLWAMYFAIVNRTVVRGLVNGCFKRPEEEPSYFFSIDRDPSDAQSWRTGTLYLLPSDGFEKQGNLVVNGQTIEVAQWRSFQTVRPLGSIKIEPEDFPFLTQVRSHDPEILSSRVAANPDGFPWVD